MDNIMHKGRKISIEEAESLNTSQRHRDQELLKKCETLQNSFENTLKEIQLFIDKYKLKDQ